MTVQEVLNWDKKHQALKGEGVRVVHIKQLIQQLLKEIDPFDLVEPCRPDCTPEQHQYHQGTWDAYIKLQKKLEELGVPKYEHANRQTKQNQEFMGRTIGSKNRPIEERLKLENLHLKQQLKELRGEYLKDMRIFWHKLKTMQNIQRVHSSEIGDIKAHLKGKGLWYLTSRDI